MQTKEQIEAEFKNGGGWDFDTNPEDATRKQVILTKLKSVHPENFFRLLDLGAYKGWLTKSYPAAHKYGYEISDEAAKDFPHNVDRITQPTGLYDLVCATGVLYSHYQYPKFFTLMKEHSSSIILTCNIKDWEREELKDKAWHKSHLNAEQILEYEFPYREYKQKLRIFKKLMGWEKQ